MRIVVLLQDGVPIEAVTMSDVLTRDFEWKEFRDKVQSDRAKILLAAYVNLHPSVDPRKVELNDLPQLSTYILHVRNMKEAPT